MKHGKLVAAITLIVIGFLGGLVIGLYFFTQGIAAIKQKDVIGGLLHILLWAELAGGGFILLFVGPGMLILRSMDDNASVLTAQKSEADAKSKPGVDG